MGALEAGSMGAAVGVLGEAGWAGAAVGVLGEAGWMGAALWVHWQGRVGVLEGCEILSVSVPKKSRGAAGVGAPAGGLRAVGGKG